MFQVFADNVKIYDSAVMTGSSATKQIDVPVAGTQQLKLVVTDGGDNIDWDHGDSANARLTTQPTVAASSFDFDTAPHALQLHVPRQRLRHLSTADLTLMNLTTNTPVPAASITLDYNTTTNVATFTFPGFTDGIVPDARYRETLLASGITDAAGNPMSIDLRLRLLLPHRRRQSRWDGRSVRLQRAQRPLRPVEPDVQHRRFQLRRLSEFDRFQPAGHQVRQQPVAAGTWHLVARIRDADRWSIRFATIFLS